MEIRNQILPRDNKGKFLEGLRYSPDNEFKKGEHWRDKQPYWDYDFLYNEYVVKRLSAYEIALMFGCNYKTILYFLNKHKIKARTTSEVRANKYWGQIGEANPMFGRKGNMSATWKGGITSERQLFYVSLEWKEVSKKTWEKYGTCCQKCSKSGGRINTNLEKGKYHIHHIVSFSVKELRTAEDNLIVLCKKCHLWVHSKKNVNKEFILTYEQYLTNQLLKKAV